MVSIRKATTEDIPLINKLAWIAFPATYQDILTKEQIDYMMDWMYSPENLLKQMTEEGHVYYIAFTDNEPAGYVSIQKEAEDLFHLQKIYVLPKFQKEHIGKLLFCKAKEAVKEINKKPCRMELNVNRNNKALGFYLHMGMKKASEGDFDIGNGFYMNDYIMSIDIE
ncbi:GNAT family N-acetyltransferase [uncultured Bacteroides sp.]|uniref:GNAT family N-acetyltransferase n=1 Tax=uncultured Bacteroides sp. TaxID=162156 RepID=UPI00261727E9|nr:GNAT family N-acetyltransferase [uncultured Bacteroides sp.]